MNPANTPFDFYGRNTVSYSPILSKTRNTFIIPYFPASCKGFCEYFLKFSHLHRKLL